jgi:tRNA-splicing ligase RtcB
VSLEDRDLAYLQEGIPEFYDYMRDLMWAQRFALENREEMMDRVIEQIERLVPTVKEVHRINSHHNFTQKELHFDKVVWVTRKGAVQASEGKWGIIPGSMATGTFIVQGLGNKDSFESAPHGAGRRMSRSQAKKQFTLEDLQQRMQGISSNVRASLIDEHPDAYKDVNMVIDRSSELVEVKHTLRQVMNIKGD